MRPASHAALAAPGPSRRVVVSVPLSASAFPFRAGGTAKVAPTSRSGVSKPCLPRVGRQDPGGADRPVRTRGQRRGQGGRGSGALGPSVAVPGGATSPAWAPSTVPLWLSSARDAAVRAHSAGGEQSGPRDRCH